MSLLRSLGMCTRFLEAILCARAMYLSALSDGASLARSKRILILSLAIR
jgi:hypothetical protein